MGRQITAPNENVCALLHCIFTEDNVKTSLHKWGIIGYKEFDLNDTHYEEQDDYGYNDDYEPNAFDLLEAEAFRRKL